jgi:hypothetical protein
MPEEVTQQIPKLKGLIDDKAELELYLSFRNLYSYIDAALRKLEASITEKIQSGKIAHEDVNGLVNLFSTPLAGSNINDPLVQSLIQSFGSQAQDLFFASPAGAAGSPAFRSISSQDFSANQLPLAKLDLKITKTDDGLTKTTAAAPYINDGYITLKDNNGNIVKVMTTA